MAKAEVDTKEEEVVAEMSAEEVKKSEIDEQIEGLLIVLVEAALNKKAKDLQILDVRGLVSYTDYFVVCSGTNDRQVKAIADAVLGEMRELNYRPLGIEGLNSGRWVVIDFGDYVVHVFHDEERENYAIEKLWSDAPRLPVPD